MILVDHIECAHMRRKVTCVGIVFRRVSVFGLVLVLWGGIHPKQRKEVGSRRSSLRGRKKKDGVAL